LWAVFRLGLIASVALSSMSFSADDAEARRGGKVRSSKERSTSDDHSTKPKSDEQHDAHGADDASSGGMSVPRVRSREATRGSDDTVSDAADGMPSPRRHTPHARAVSVPVQDLDVPGCPTGMICTVCLAGCPSDIGGIVDAQAKTPVPVQEN
jgi:hypothetical protein